MLYNKFEETLEHTLWNCLLVPFGAAGPWEKVTAERYLCNAELYSKHLCFGLHPFLKSSGYIVFRQLQKRWLCMLGRMCVLWTLKVGLMKPVNAQPLNWLCFGRGARSDDTISNGLDLIRCLYNSYFNGSYGYFFLFPKSLLGYSMALLYIGGLVSLFPFFFLF